MEASQRCDGGQDLSVTVAEQCEPRPWKEDQLKAKYQKRRAEYVDSLFNIINWDNVAERFDAAHVRSSS